MERASLEGDKATESNDACMQNQVVARSHIGTAFYLFNHQAGGHKPFLRSALGEVCKPVIPLELQFYQSLDYKYPQLKAFVPPFVGVITVDLHPLTPAEAVSSANSILESSSNLSSDRDSSDGDSVSSEGSVDDHASVHDESKAEETSEATAVVDGQILSRLQLQSPKGTTAIVAPTTPATSASSKKRRLRGSLRVGGPASATAGSTASYSTKLWKKERSKATQCRNGKSVSLQSQRSALSREYLVLGDLTLKYSHPCVLDIKMGTRQHGEDAPPAKARSHSLKCAATTSLLLGLRICGMQIYDEVEQRYTLWDKHWGRQLKADDIEPALRTYLSNGTGLHRGSLRALRDKLLSLQNLIATTTGVRFWGSSLLLIYEGDLRNAPQREDVHLIDFAHCQMSDSLDSPDEGLLLGLANMIRYLTSILDQSSTE